MARYFFTICKDSHAPDTVGVELVDADAARREAARCMGEDMQSDPDVIWNDEQWRIDVADETGLILFSIFSSAIESAAGSRR